MHASECLFFFNPVIFVLTKYPPPPKHCHDITYECRVAFLKRVSSAAEDTPYSTSEFMSQNP